MKKYVAFDIETAQVIPKGETDWAKYRPLGISVAATLIYPPHPGILRHWYGQGRPSRDPMLRMPQAQVQVLVRFLQRLVDDGYTIITWNGVRFDFSVLAQESGLHQECAALALGQHIDPMFHFFCENGWGIGLDAAARGMGLQGKTEGVPGADAPILWAEGQYAKVMAYVGQDVSTTLELVQAIDEMGGLCWRTTSDQTRTWWPQAGRLLTASEALALPLPEPPSWIPDPWTREEFIDWMKGGAPDV